MSSHDPVKILLDGRMLLGRFSGVARFVTRLVDHLALRKDVSVSVLCGNELYEPWRTRTDIRLIPSTFSRADRTPSRRRQWEAQNLHHVIRAANVDIFHATWNTGVPRACGVPTVLTVHDLIPWHQAPATLSARRERWHYRRAQRHAIRNATLITTVSHYVRRQVIARWPARAHAIHTVYNGVDLSKPAGLRGERRAKTDPDRTHRETPFALYVGGHEARKNLEGLFRTMDAYWEHFDEHLTLKLTGAPDTLTPAARRALDRVRHRDRIQFLGKVNERELHEAYDTAVALLFLSRDEGFGLPALESMARGCPVIASNRASLPEVVGDAGLLVSPDSSTEAASALHRILTDSPLRAELRSRGWTRAAAFSWEATAEAMLAYYRSALGLPTAASRSGNIVKSQAFPHTADMHLPDPPGSIAAPAVSPPPHHAGHPG